MAFKKVVLRTFNNYDTDEASDESALTCLDPSLAQQHQEEEANINNIVRKFGITGKLPDNVRIPLNVDFDDVFDYQTALNTMRDADNAFMKMPPEIRARFANDAGVFVDFVSDPANIEEARKMGLAIPAVVVQDPPNPANTPV